MAAVTTFATVTPPGFSTLPPAAPVTGTSGSAGDSAANTAAATSPAPNNTPSPDDVTAGIYSAVAAVNTSTIRGTTLDVTA